MSRLASIAALGDRRRRRDAARELAVSLGAEDLLVFVLDPEVDTPLPALGFPQTLPDGRRWRDFVRRSLAEKQPISEPRPYPDAKTVRLARAVPCAPEAVLVLIGGEPRADAVEELCALMPL